MAKSKPKIRLHAKPPSALDDAAAQELEERFAQRGGEIPNLESRIKKRGTSAAQADTRWTRQRDGVALRRTTVHLPEELYRRLKHLAVDSHRSLSDIAQEALTQWLEEGG